MVLYPNQKQIVIHKEPTDNKSKENYYSKTNLFAEQKAIQALKGNTFKVWRYFSINQNNYSFALSSKDVTYFCKISESTYHKCIAELIEKQYLVKQNDYNIYDFYEKPKETIEQKTTEDIETTEQTISSNINVMEINDTMQQSITHSYRF